MILKLCARCNGLYYFLFGRGHFLYSYSTISYHINPKYSIRALGYGSSYDLNQLDYISLGFAVAVPPFSS